MSATTSPLVAALVALAKADVSEAQMQQLLANLATEGPAKPKSSKKATPAQDERPDAKVHMLCKATRKAFVAAAAKDGHDFEGWPTRKIAEACIAEGYAPNGFAIGEGYRKMFEAPTSQPKVTSEPKAQKKDKKAKKAAKKAHEEAEAAKAVVIVEANNAPVTHKPARLRGSDGRYLPSRNTKGLTREVVDEMIAFCREKGIEPIGTAWDELRAGERRSRVLRARNKRDGITPPEPMDARVVTLVRAGYGVDEATQIVATLQG